MELKTMFPNLNVMWGRWSEYTTVTDRGGAEYLVPAPGAAELIYNCSHAKSEFCSARCRNYFNVKAFRERDKGSETGRNR